MQEDRHNDGIPLSDSHNSSRRKHLNRSGIVVTNREYSYRSLLLISFAILKWVLVKVEFYG